MGRAKQVMFIQNHNINMSWSLKCMKRIKIQYGSITKDRKDKIYLKCFKILAYSESD